jgi:hypothetical protein
MSRELEDGTLYFKDTGHKDMNCIDVSQKGSG